MRWDGMRTAVGLGMELREKVAAELLQDSGMGERCTRGVAGLGDWKEAWGDAGCKIQALTEEERLCEIAQVVVRRGQRLRHGVEVYRGAHRELHVES